jgi:hypothetical protein
MMIVIYVVAAATVFWVGMITAFLGGLVFVILAAVGAGLKLAGVIALSWWWALLPLWGAMGGAYVKMRLAARDPNF